MATKYAYKLSGMALKVDTGNGNFVEIPGLVQFTEPEFEPNTEEIGGKSGMAGRINMPDWSDINPAEIVLTFDGLPDDFKYLLTADTINAKIAYCEKSFDKTYATSEDLYIDNFKGKLSKYTPGEGEVGSKKQFEFTYAIASFKQTKGGNVVMDYDPANGVVNLGGTDAIQAVTNLLANA